MVRIIIALLFCFPVALSAQTYQQLSEKAIECIEMCSILKNYGISEAYLE